ncbi:hypothetical protein BOO24_19545 [Vibrio navarrensis]|nr:hypothetical protein [Vibrio navarrensis]
MIQEPTQTRAMINKPPKQSSPFSNKPSFWNRQVQRAKNSASAKRSINLHFPHFAHAELTTNQRQKLIEASKEPCLFYGLS